MSIINALLVLGIGFIIAGSIGAIATAIQWAGCVRYMGASTLTKVGFFGFFLMFFVGMFLVGGLG